MMHKPVVYEKPLEILGITYIGGILVSPYFYRCSYWVVEETLEETLKPTPRE